MTNTDAIYKSCMIRKAKILFFIISLFAVDVHAQEVYASFAPGELWLDNNGVHINAHGGGILHSGGKYYWFGEHKIEGEAGNYSHVGVHCYSSADLYNWTDEGIALSVDLPNSGSEIEKGCILERPKVIFNKKYNKYVMWFHLEPKGKGYSGAKSGVAISDNITGPYVFLEAVRPNSQSWPINVLPTHKSGVWENGTYSGGSLPAHPDSLNILARDFSSGQMARDMNLFVDEDNIAYHIYSSEENSTLHIAELDETYTKHTGRYKRIFVGRFMEAPAMFKYENKYYLIMSGCTGWDPNAARLAVADSIFGDWEELGNPCVGQDSELTFYSQSSFVFPVVHSDSST